MADRAPERLARPVYQDVAIPRDGTALVDLLPAAQRAETAQRVREEGVGWLIPGQPATLPIQA